MIILAAGQGTRLGDLTTATPKALTKIGGRALLEYQLGILDKYEIEPVIVTGYLSEKFNKYNLRLVVNEDYRSTNMLYSLMLAREILLNGMPSIICYGDIIYEKFVLEHLLTFNGQFGLPINSRWFDLWSLRMEDPLEDAETLKLTNGKVIEIGFAPKSLSEIDGQYMGMFRISSTTAKKVISIYDSLPKELQLTWSLTPFINHLIFQNISISAIPIPGGWFELDTLNDFNLAKKIVSYHDGNVRIDF